MKLFGLFSLFLLALPSTMALRGAAENESPEEAVVTERILRSSSGKTYAGYTKKKGSCRMKSDGTGAGKDGVHFDRYKKSEIPEVSYDWCYQKCESNPKCTGWEYKFTGDEHCELWTFDFKGTDDSMSSFYCYFKNDGGGGGGAPKYDTFTKYDGACRKNRDNSGAGTSGTDFVRYKKSKVPKLSFDWCHDKCKGEGFGCTGFEYVDAGSKSHCEIWSHVIKGYNKNIKNAYCYVNQKMPRGGN